MGSALYTPLAVLAIGLGLIAVVLSQFRAARQEQAAAARGLREELAGQARTASELQENRLGAIRESLTQADREMRDSLARMARDVQGQVEQVGEKVGAHLVKLQEANEKKLEEMRVTVDEKLHGTLEKRLGESFKLVSERLEAVQRGLGEMQSLATGVGDLKKVLTNVKTRGTWGEYQLGAILEQILTPDQYVANYHTAEGNEVVEFAVKLPGHDGQGPIHLPIDSKCPQEDYERVLQAAEAGDAEGLKTAIAALIRAVKGCAKDIRDKYLRPPETTDFGIMFLPTEGLYAEVLRQPGLVEQLQREYHVNVVGPTTLSAFLNSLRMGFHTLAIQQRSTEIWQVLGAVKTEFGKFGEKLSRLKRQLDTAAKTVDATAQRTRAMERKLKSVESLPAGEAADLLQLPAPADDPDDVEDLSPVER